MSFTAVVLAGSRPGRDAFAESFGTDLKALIPVAGGPMVRRPVRALLESAAVAKVVVLTQAPERVAEALPADGRVRVRQSHGTIAETMLGLIDDPATEWPLLVTTADHALLDAATVDEFARETTGSDIAIGLVERANLLKRLPQTKRTWLKFRGGAYTGANLFVLTSPRVRPAIELWRSVEQDRKKGWRLIGLFGPVVLAGAALRLLGIDDVLARVGRKLGLRIKAVRLSNPLAGVDVDKAEDHALVEAILNGDPLLRSSRAQSRDATPRVSTSLDTSGLGKGRG
jgi:GTP:adenosylcobinamide-phosphate guanylyltransferase